MDVCLGQFQSLASHVGCQKQTKIIRIVPDNNANHQKSFFGLNISLILTDTNQLTSSLPDTCSYSNLIEINILLFDQISNFRVH